MRIDFDSPRLVIEAYEFGFVGLHSSHCPFGPDHTDYKDWMDAHRQGYFDAVDAGELAEDGPFVMPDGAFTARPGAV